MKYEIAKMVEKVVGWSNEGKMTFCEFVIDGRRFKECLDDITHLTNYFEQLGEVDEIKVYAIKVSFR